MVYHLRLLDSLRLEWPLKFPTRLSPEPAPFIPLLPRLSRGSRSTVRDIEISNRLISGSDARAFIDFPGTPWRRSSRLFASPRSGSERKTTRKGEPDREKLSALSSSICPCRAKSLDRSGIIDDFSIAWLDSRKRDNRCRILSPRSSRPLSGSDRKSRMSALDFRFAGNRGED